MIVTNCLCSVHYYNIQFYVTIDFPSEGRMLHISNRSTYLDVSYLGDIFVVNWCFYHYLYQGPLSKLLSKLYKLVGSGSMGLIPLGRGRSLVTVRNEQRGMTFFVIGGPSPLKGLKTERRFKLAEKLILIDHISWFFHSRAFYQIPLIFWWHYMEKASIYM